MPQNAASDQGLQGLPLVQCFVDISLTCSKYDTGMVKSEGVRIFRVNETQSDKTDLRAILIICNLNLF